MSTSWTSLYRVCKASPGLTKKADLEGLAKTVFVTLPITLAGLSATAGYFGHQGVRGFNVMNNLHKVRMDKLDEYIKDLEAQETFLRYSKKKKEDDQND